MQRFDTTNESDEIKKIEAIIYAYSIENQKYFNERINFLEKKLEQKIEKNEAEIKRKIDGEGTVILEVLKEALPYFYDNTIKKIKESEEKIVGKMEANFQTLDIPRRMR